MSLMAFKMTTDVHMNMTTNRSKCAHQYCYEGPHTYDCERAHVYDYGYAHVYYYEWVAHVLESAVLFSFKKFMIF